MPTSKTRKDVKEKMRKKGLGGAYVRALNETGLLRKIVSENSMRGTSGTERELMGASVYYSDFAGWGTNFFYAG